MNTHPEAFVVRDRSTLLKFSAGAMILLSTIGCVSTPAGDLNPTQPYPLTPEQVKTATDVAPQPSSTVVQTPTSSPVATTLPMPTPMPTATEHPAVLSIGQPVWIGRGKIVSAVFLPGARQIAIGWGNGVSLNTVDSGRELWFQATPSNVIAFDVQAQGQAFAVALSDGSVMTFEATSGKSQRFQGVKLNASWGDIAWSPDGRTLAFQYVVFSGPRDPSPNDPIYLLDVASGRIGEAPDSQTAYGVIPQLVWSPDGSSILVTALGDHFPRFIDVKTGQERMRLAHPGQVVSSQPFFLADGKTIASEGPAGEVELRRFPDGVKLRTLQSGSRLLGRWLIEFPDAGGPLFSDPAGRWITYRGGYESCYCGSGATPSQYPLIIWDLVRGVVKARLNQAVGGLKDRHRLAATFDGDSILMLYESGEITRWAFSAPQARETVVAHVPVRLVSSRTLTWSADGSRLSLSGIDDGVEVYDTTGRLVQRFDPPFTAPALSPDGHLAALFDPDQKAEVLYQVQDKHLVKTLPASPVLMGAAFSPDGKFLAYGARDHAAVIELTSGRVISLDLAGAVPAHADLTFARLIWSPDGQSLIAIIKAGSPNEADLGVIILWKRLENGTFKEVYHVATLQVSNTTWILATFSPSSRRVALQTMPDKNSGQAEQPELIVYDLEAGKVIQTLPDYRLGTWLNDEDLLAAEMQYDRRLTLIHVMNGQKTMAGSIDAVAYSPGGNFIAQVEWSPDHTDPSVTIRKWQSGAVVARVSYASVSLADHPWSPDGRWLATLGDNGTLRIWPVATNK